MPKLPKNERPSPASLVFSNGVLAAACLDRNGLRPARYKLTEDGIFSLGSEVGCTELDDAKVIEKGRLAPGEMIAVDTREGKLLRDAEIKSLSEISNEMRDLAARARSKRLAPHEYQGGSTTISNLGMYGIDRFDAVINPPQASILAVGRAEKRPVVKDDALKIATMMSVTLSVDHRVIDGALGAELLAAFKAYIEDPVTMLV